MTAELLALLDKDPAAGILATADLREQRAKDITPYWDDYRYGPKHIAAEANPAHALAAVRRWRGVVERHRRTRPKEIQHGALGALAERLLSVCSAGCPEWPCPDLTETADEARAYLSGAS